MMNELPHIGMSTPWGPAQSVNPGPVPGTFWISTANHGGLYVPESVRRQMPPLYLMPSRFYGGGPWFEEDCEVARVILSFPKYFENPELEEAQNIWRACRPMAAVPGI